MPISLFNCFVLSLPFFSSHSPPRPQDRAEISQPWASFGSLAFCTLPVKGDLPLPPSFLLFSSLFLFTLLASSPSQFLPLVRDSLSLPILSRYNFFSSRPPLLFRPFNIFSHRVIVPHPFSLSSLTRRAPCVRSATGFNSRSTGVSVPPLISPRSHVAINAFFPLFVPKPS